MVRTCPHCGCSDIDEDAARGDATCTGCGTVLEESIVVSENQFQERAGGSGHTLVGQFVSMERAQTHTLQGVPGLSSQESREVTFQKGRKLIEEIASQLRINQHCIDTSYNFFKMCVSRNLTRGRIRSHVVASCMYMTCRLENTAHLLLDFSDVTQVNVFDLGRTLSFLSRSLRINLPSTDPCLYIMRFACLLDFDDKQKEVVNLATRLVQRMKRDWMSTGRRPTGLCGAALLIAARAFNFNRTISDVVRVVHISESVVRKRLDEFSQTPSGALTIDEFATVDLEHSEDPPAFREAKRKAREEQLLKEAEIAERMEKEIEPMEEEVERALEKKRRDKFKHTAYAKLVAGRIDDPEVGNAEAALVRDDIIDSVYDAADGRLSPTANNFAQFRPTLQSLGISAFRPTPLVVASYDPLPAADNVNGDLACDDIDDEEIDSYILSQAEASMKERFWMKCNGEHVKEMERRKREREEQEEKDKDNPTKKKKRRIGTTTRVGQSATASEAMEKVIQEKKLSNKVNYDILKEIEQCAGPVKNERDPAEVVKEAKLVIAKIEAIYEKEKQNEECTVDQSANSAIDDLSKRELELRRRNSHHSSVNHLSVLQSALKVDLSNKSTSVSVPASHGGDTSSSPISSMKSESKPTLLFSRNRFGRATPKPNIGGISVKKESDSPLVSNNVHTCSTSQNISEHVIDIKAPPEDIGKECSVQVDELQKGTPISKNPVSKAVKHTTLSGTVKSLSRSRKPVSKISSTVISSPNVDTESNANVLITTPSPKEGVSPDIESTTTVEVPKKAVALSRGRKSAPLLLKTAEKSAPDQTDGSSSSTSSATPSRKIKANIPEELLRRSSRR